MRYHEDDYLYPDDREPGSVWERTGLNRRERRVLDASLFVLMGIFTVGWIYSTAVALARNNDPSLVRRIGATESPLSSTSRPNASFTMSAVLERFVNWEDVRGESGAIRIVVQEGGDSMLLPDSLPAETTIGYIPRLPEGADPAVTMASDVLPDRPGQPGIWNMIAYSRGVTRLIPDLSVVTLIPSTALRAGRIGNFRIGSWPRGQGKYAPPGGFIEVTPENRNTPVSEHFVLGDFLTKGQEGVWPKYVALQPLLLDKLELTLQELELMGHPVENVFVISGFRTPSYNESGGDPRGRAAMSRHMYGDAADIAIDNNGDGCMDDLNGDGKVDINDARIVAEAAERVESRHPDLVGGIGIYRPNPGSHCGFVHIDTRGYRARW
ncbi:MAG: hypothetical protein LBG44_04385 [Gemmatimonadota bacterium]|nr:hypothetical protein [Gemmatimonadota bacterium]